MRSFKNILVAALFLAVGCAPAGDADRSLLEPVVGTADYGLVESTEGVEDNILTQGPGAPALETLQATFVAVVGEGHSFRIRYDVPGEVENPSPDFFRLDLDKETLLARPDGTPFAEGETVEITVTVDPQRLIVDLEPSGLRFNPDRPARLRLWYVRANPDLNRDGVVDQLDRDVEVGLLGLYFRADATSPWERLDAEQNLLRKRFSIDIEHFSGYTVSW